MDIKSLQTAVVGAVNAQLEGKASAESVAALEVKNAEQAEIITSLQASIEEVKQLSADTEAKFSTNEIQIGTKTMELQFDQKALNVKLKEIFSSKNAAVNFADVDTKALTIGGAGDAQLAIDAELGRTVIERARENVAILGLIANKSVGSVEYREMVLRAYPATAGQAEQTGTTGNGTVWGQTGTQSYVEVAMTVGKQYSKPLISMEAVSDPHVDIYAHLVSLLAEETSRYWAKQVFFGTGSGNDLRGILHNHATTGRIDPTISAVVDAGVRDVNYFPVVASGILNSIGDSDSTAALSAIDTAIDLTVFLPTKYLSGAKFIMNRRTLGQYRKLKDAEGRPLISFDAGGFSLVGYGVVIEDYMPDVDGANEGTQTVKTPVIFGDLSKAFALCSISDNFLFNPYKADGAIMLEYTSRKGDIVQNNDAIVILASEITFA